jgi:hypothetical protein
MATSSQSGGSGGGAHGRIPDFFVVGQHKSGTTALHRMLREHPQVFLPRLKEPRFFAPDMAWRFPPPWDPVLPQTREEYEALFADAGPGQRTGEVSAAYLVSRDAPRLIAEAQPQGRVIAILRDPVSFLRSFHQNTQRVGLEDEPDLRRALALEPERREGRNVPDGAYWPQLLQYTEHATYLPLLRRWHEHFAREQVLVLIYEEFRRDNAGTLRQICEFIGVDEGAPLPQVDVHVTQQVRSPRLNRAMRAVTTGNAPAARAARSAIKAVAPRNLRRRAFGSVRKSLVVGEVAPMDPQLETELRQRFRPQVEQLGEYLGRDLLAVWGYGEPRD